MNVTELVKILQTECHPEAEVLVYFDGNRVEIDDVDPFEYTVDLNITVNKGD
jgi:hypothetical protein